MKRKKLIQRKHTVNPEGNGVSEHNERLYKSLTRNLHEVQEHKDIDRPLALMLVVVILGLFLALFIETL